MPQYIADAVVKVHYGLVNYVSQGKRKGIAPQIIGI